MPYYSLRYLVCVNTNHFNNLNSLNKIQWKNKIQAADLKHHMIFVEIREDNINKKQGKKLSLRK
jgi:hypothetical protein